MNHLPFDFSQFAWHFSIVSVLILSILAGIIGYQAKDKSFKLYAVYGFTLLIYLLTKAPYDFPFRDQLYNSRFWGLNWYIQVIYYSAYFVFFIYFLNIKTHLYSFYRRIKFIILFIFVVSTAFFIISLIFNLQDYFQLFFIYIFTPVTTLFAIYTIIMALTLPGKLKYFIAIGGGAYVALALVALYVSMNGNLLFGLTSMFYFYVGVFIEHIVLAVGLAYKVRYINKSMILHYQENVRIKKEQSSLLKQKLKKREKEIYKLTEEAEKVRIKNIESKYKDEVNKLHLVSLKNQMNPHFIFNALNSIKVFLIDNNKNQAIYYLNKFSKLIRVILESSRLSAVSLEQELQTISLYFDIEKMRFNNDVEFNINIHEGVNPKAIKVPPLLLQPFVENSLWHGLMLSKGVKILDIEVFEKDGATVLSLKDNGVGRAKASENREKKTYKKESIGLKITKERLKYFNDSENHNYEYKIIDMYNADGKAAGTNVVFYFI